MSIQLTSYSIRVTDRNSHIFLPLDNFNAGADLFLIMDQNFASLKRGLSKHDDLLTTFGVSLFNVSNKRHISGLIKSGDYGIETDLININSNEITYHRQKNETEPRPFYFLVYIPKNTTIGILLLERNGIYGVKTVFYNYFKSYFEKQFPQFIFSLDLLTPTDLIENVLKEGRFTKIRFIKEGIPNNFEDVISNSRGNFILKGQFEQSITVPRGGFLGNVADRILDVIHDRRTVKNMYEIPDDYDNVKAEVEINGQYRTLDISNIERYRPNFNVTDKVELGTNGYPTFETINKAGFDLLDLIIKSLDGEDVR
jgi:hypothetical protein